MHGTDSPDNGGGRNQAGAPAPGAGHDRGRGRRAAPRRSRRPAASRRQARRLTLITLLGAVGATLISLVFVVSFIGALHAPGPRSLPVGIAGTAAQASRLSASLGRQRPGGYVVTRYPTAAAARRAIFTRGVDAALVPGPPRQVVLLVASATSQAATIATVLDVQAAAGRAGLHPVVRNIRPLPAGDPQGLSQVFFVTALLTPSLLFGNLLVNRFGRAMRPASQIAAVAVYAVIVAAVATAIADPGIGALTGAPWGLFGIGVLLAFAATVAVAGATRWGRGLGYAVIFLLFVPVGIASSGTTLGPYMITPWYADLGRALPAGSALRAVQNTVYFNGNAIIAPLLVLSAWALAGLGALALVAVFHPPTPGRREPRPDQPAGTGTPSGAALQQAGTRR